MDREKSTARKISAERSWPTLSSTEQPSRTSGDSRRRKRNRPEKNSGRENGNESEKARRRENGNRPEKGCRRKKREQTGKKGAEPAGGYDHSLRNEKNCIYKFGTGKPESGKWQRIRRSAPRPESRCCRRRPAPHTDTQRRCRKPEPYFGPPSGRG